MTNRRHDTRRATGHQPSPRLCGTRRYWSRHRCIGRGRHALSQTAHPGEGQHRAHRLACMGPELERETHMANAEPSLHVPVRLRPRHEFAHESQFGLAWLSRSRSGPGGTRTSGDVPACTATMRPLRTSSSVNGGGLSGTPAGKGGCRAS